MLAEKEHGLTTKPHLESERIEGSTFIHHEEILVLEEKRGSTIPQCKVFV
jgi:hypothetical protein